MNNKNIGALNKKEMDKKRNLFLMVGIVILLVVMLALFIVRTKSDNLSKQKADFSTIIEKAETKIVFVESSDAKKCKNCATIKKYLDDNKIDYLTYDVEDYSKKEYTDMLKSIEVNPGDFGYPAVIYMKDGKLYADAINLTDTTSLESFIKTYELNSNK